MPALSHGVNTQASCCRAYSLEACLTVAFQELDNAANRVDKTDTAFSHRDARYDCVAISGWIDPAEAETNIRWTHEFFALTRAFSPSGIYVNGVMEPETVKFAYRDETY